MVVQCQPHRCVRQECLVCSIKCVAGHADTGVQMVLVEVALLFAGYGDGHQALRLPPWRELAPVAA